MTPTASPCGTSKETSFKAQILPASWLLPCRRRKRAFRKVPVIRSRNVPYVSRCWPMRYCLLSFSTWMAVVAAMDLYDVRECSLRAAEENNARDQRCDGCDRRNQQHLCGHFATAR